MRAIEAIILGGAIDVVGDGTLAVVAHLVDAALGEVGLDAFEFAEMAAAVAVLADAGGGVVVLKAGVE